MNTRRPVPWLWEHSDEVWGGGGGRGERRLENGKTTTTMQKYGLICIIHWHEMFDSICRDVLLIWMIVGQVPSVLAVGEGGVYEYFSHSFFFLPLSGRQSDTD